MKRALPAWTASGVIPSIRTEAAMSQGEVQAPGATHVKQRLVVEYGLELDGVWLPIAMLRRLGAHGPWDRPLTTVTSRLEARADQLPAMATQPPRIPDNERAQLRLPAAPSARSPHG